MSQLHSSLNGIGCFPTASRHGAATSLACDTRSRRVVQNKEHFFAGLKTVSRFRPFVLQHSKSTLLKHTSRTDVMHGDSRVNRTTTLFVQQQNQSPRCNALSPGRTPNPISNRQLRFAEKTGNAADQFVIGNNGSTQNRVVGEDDRPVRCEFRLSSWNDCGQFAGDGVTLKLKQSRQIVGQYRTQVNRQEKCLAEKSVSSHRVRLLPQGPAASFKRYDEKRPAPADRRNRQTVLFLPGIYGDFETAIAFSNWKPRAPAWAFITSVNASPSTTG